MASPVVEEAAMATVRREIGALPAGRLRHALNVSFGTRADASAARARTDAAQKMHKDRGLPHFASELQALVPEAVLDLHASEIGAEGARQLAGILRLRGSQTLRHLDLSSCNLTDLGTNFEALGELMIALQRHTQLLSLDLSKNMISKQGSRPVARLLEQLPNLKYLDLSRNNLRSEGTSAIASAIDPEENPQTSLLSLSLSENNISNFNEASRGAMALAGAVRAHPTLTALDLSHNRLDRAALHALGVALEETGSLIDLRLDDNHVGPSEAAALAAGLRRNPCLTRLSLRDNVILGDGAVALAKALRSRTAALSVLDVRFNNIAQYGRVFLAHAVLPRAPAVQAALKEVFDEEAETARLAADAHHHVVEEDEEGASGDAAGASEHKETHPEMAPRDSRQQGRRGRRVVKLPSGPYWGRDSSRRKRRQTWSDTESDDEDEEQGRAKGEGQVRRASAAGHVGDDSAGDDSAGSSAEEEEEGSRPVRRRKSEKVCAGGGDAAVAPEGGESVPLPHGDWARWEEEEASMTVDLEADEVILRSRLTGRIVLF